MPRSAMGLLSQLLLISAVTVPLGIAPPVAGADEPGSVELGSPEAKAVAAQLDELLEKELTKSGAPLAPAADDQDFLRRVTFDLAGTIPSPAELTLFSLNPDPRKRAKLVDRLLQTDAFAENWARYWRDVIYSRATDQRARLSQPAFEAWMTEQLKANTPWDEVATALVTATGDVTENGQTALVFAHGGQAPELAAETSRIFLGIQIQCANCHDHPYDVWKREQFHQLAAYFPRIRVRRSPDSDRRSFEVVSADAPNARRISPARLLRRFDGNNDRKLTKDEVKQTPLARFFDRALRRADEDGDEALSLKELEKVPFPAGRRRGNVEYFMPDLSDPSSRGTRVHPVFFVGSRETERGLDDRERRQSLAASLTDESNPWFARAFVNRIWAELLGAGFYTPVDDMGPERTASFPKVLDLLAAGFVESDYDVKWVFRTITNTRAYQRRMRTADPAGAPVPFASASPTRLRGDQLYNALTEVLGVDELGRTGRRRRGGYRGPRSQRAQFTQLFGFDPSTPQQDVTGDVPQALFLMNSPLINNLIRGQGNTRLGRILQKFDDDREAVSELYVLVLAREPSEKEVNVALEYIGEVGDRREAFEDLMWALLNSSEFLTKR